MKFQYNLTSKIKARATTKLPFYFCREKWMENSLLKSLSLKLFRRWERLMPSVDFILAPSPPVLSPHPHYWITISSPATSGIVCEIMNWFLLIPFRNLSWLPAAWKVKSKQNPWQPHHSSCLGSSWLLLSKLLPFFLLSVSIPFFYTNCLPHIFPPERSFFKCKGQMLQSLESSQTLSPE